MPLASYHTKYLINILINKEIYDKIISAVFIKGIKKLKFSF